MGANKCVTKCLLIGPILYGFITHSFLVVRLMVLRRSQTNKQTAYTNHLNGMYLVSTSHYYLLSNMFERTRNGCCTVHSRLTHLVSVSHREFWKQNFSIIFFFFACKCTSTFTQNGGTALNKCWNVVAHFLQFFMLARRKISFCYISQSPPRVVCLASLCLSASVKHRSFWHFHIF